MIMSTAEHLSGPCDIVPIIFQRPSAPIWQKCKMLHILFDAKSMGPFLENNSQRSRQQRHNTDIATSQ